jgi:uncharacterized membrane protein YfcA
MNYLFLAAIGFLGGFSGGLFGVGGGVIFVPLLILACKMNPHQAIATSLAAIVPTAFVAVIKHTQSGFTMWNVIPCLVGFALIGSWVGSSLSVQMDMVILKRLYAVFLLLVSLKLFFSK